MKAPTSGITAGLSLTEYSDSLQGGSTPYFNNVSTIKLTGAIYFPRRLFYLQQGGSISSFGGTSGCGHIIAWQVDVENGVSVGNNCAGIGVLPFGSSTAAWGSSACSAAGGSKDTNCLATGTTTAAATPANVKIVE